jgi:hypothetical protein
VSWRPSIFVRPSSSGSSAVVQQERADHDPQLVKRIGQGGIERGGQQVNERLEGRIDGGVPKGFLVAEADAEQVVAASEIPVECAQRDTLVGRVAKALNASSKMSSRVAAASSDRDRLPGLIRRHPVGVCRLRNPTPPCCPSRRAHTLASADPSW